jgi:hypothetical protein
LFDKPWFHNWGKTCCCAHHTFSWGSQLVGHLHQHRTINNIPIKYTLNMASELQKNVKDGILVFKEITTM